MSSRNIVTDDANVRAPAPRRWRPAIRRPMAAVVLFVSLNVVCAVGSIAVINRPDRGSAGQIVLANDVLAGGPLTGNSGGLDKKKAQIDAELAKANSIYESASAKVQAAAAAYATATAALPSAQAGLADATGSVIASTVALDQANAAAVAAQHVANKAQAALAVANARVRNGRAQIATVVASAYEGSGLIELNSVMDSGTPSDILDRLAFMDQVVVSQRRTLDGYVTARMRATDAFNAAAVAAHRATQAKTVATGALNRSRAAKAKAASATASVAALVTARQKALGVAQANKAQTLAQYKALQTESDQVETELKAQAARDRAEAAKHKKGGGSSGGGTKTGPVTSTSGYFIMPVHGPETSPFGERYDPFYHVWHLHSGVDIAAASGTPIHVAASGTVIRAGWDGGYGNYTCVDNGLYHGAGIATCYAHQSRILVHVGQHVSRGQVIGRVGETGAATGYHLHFEVRINGKAVQPVSWLPRCFC